MSEVDLMNLVIGKTYFVKNLGPPDNHPLPPNPRRGKKYVVTVFDKKNIPRDDLHLRPIMPVTLTDMKEVVKADSGRGHTLKGVQRQNQEIPEGEVLAYIVPNRMYKLNTVADVPKFYERNQIIDAVLPPPIGLDNKIRSLKKKLKQILILKTKDPSSLNSDQHKKLSRETELTKELVEAEQKNAPQNQEQKSSAFGGRKRKTRRRKRSKTHSRKRSKTHSRKRSKTRRKRKSRRKRRKSRSRRK